MADNAELKVKISAQVADIKAALDRLQTELKDTGAAGERAGKKVQTGIEGITSAAKRAALALGAFITAYAAIRTGTAIIKAADDFQKLEARLKLTTKSEIEYQRARAETFRIAQATGQGVSETVELYTKLARTTQNLGISQDALVRVTETVNKAISLSGASTEAAAASMLQFGQALAGPKFQAEELNSIIEQTPELARAIERGLGIAQGTLKRYAIEVGLSGREAVGALLRVSGSVDEEFSRLPDTVSRATTRIRNDLTKLAGSTDLRGLVTALEDLRIVLTDPAIIEAAGSIAQAFVTGFGTAAKFVAGLKFAIFGSADALLKLDDATRKIDAEVAGLQAITTANERAQESINARIATLLAQRADLVRQMEALYDKQADANRAQREASAAAAAANEAEARRLAAEGKKAADDAAAAEDAKTAAEQRRKAIDDIIASLTEESATHGQSAEQIALYRLAQLGATEADLERARALAGTIAALEAKEEAEKKAAKELEKRAKREKEIARELAEVEIELLRLTGQGVEARSNELSLQFDQLIADLRAKGDLAGVALVERFINLELADARLAALRDRIDKATEAFAQAQQDAANRVTTGVASPLVAQADVSAAGNQTIGELQTLRTELAALASQEIPGAADALAALDAEIVQITNASAGGLARAITNLRTEFAQMQENLAGDTVAALRTNLGQLFTDIATGSKSAKDALKDFVRGFAQSMIQIAANALATLLVLQLLDALFPGAGKAAAAGSIAAGTKHTGGIVGAGGPVRRVPGYIFAGAARFHDGGVVPGLKPGEVPTILQAGEEVLTAGDPRHRNNGGAAGGGLQSLRMVLVDDRGNIGDYMNSAEGESVQMQFIERNALTIKNILG